MGACCCGPPPYHPYPFATQFPVSLDLPGDVFFLRHCRCLTSRAATRTPPTHATHNPTACAQTQSLCICSIACLWGAHVDGVRLDTRRNVCACAMWINAVCCVCVTACCALYTTIRFGVISCVWLLYNGEAGGCKASATATACQAHWTSTSTRHTITYTHT